MDNFKDIISDIKYKHRIDLSKNLYIGLGQAFSLIEVAHDGTSDSYRDKGELSSAIMNKDVDIDFGSLESYDTIPVDVAEGIIKLFSHLDYFYLDDMNPDDMDLHGEIKIGRLPEGIEYEMRNSGYDDKTFDSVKFYKYCNYSGTLVVLYGDCNECEDLLKEIDTFYEV